MHLSHMHRMLQGHTRLTLDVQCAKQLCLYMVGGLLRDVSSDEESDSEFISWKPATHLQGSTDAPAAQAVWPGPVTNAKAFIASLRRHASSTCQHHETRILLCQGCRQCPGFTVNLDCDDAQLRSCLLEGFTIARLQFWPSQHSQLVQSRADLQKSCTSSNLSGYRVRGMKHLLVPVFNGT